MPNTTTHPVSIGKNIEKFRRMRGMKQEALAESLGISRQTLSKLEQSDEIEKEKLEQIANALGVPVEALENYNDDNVVINIENMTHSGVYQYNFNPLEKLMELIEENKALYQQVIQAEREKVALLESMLSKTNPAGA
jgi:transcriptional regulator with XRE-family HTH domain